MALTGCGGGATHRAQTAVAVAAAPLASAVAPLREHRRAVPRRPSAPGPGLVSLRNALARVLQQAGPDAGAEVYDLTTGTQLFALRNAVRRPPASVEKLYTTVALLNTLGDGARFHTTVLGVGHLGPGGVWHGSLYLRGGGDPTFGDGTFNRIWEAGYGPTSAQLAHQLAAHRIRRVTGSLIADESLFDSKRGGPATGFAPDIPDFGGQLSALTYDHGAAAAGFSPPTFAARQLALTLRTVGIKVNAAKFTARTPTRARPLASVSSPPLAVLAQLMNVPSDDLFAEVFTKQLGVESGADGTTAAGARVISDQIATYGLHPRIVDGSGLSRADRSSPHEVVALLRLIWHTGVGHVVSASLPVVGVNGTTRRIGVHTAAQGNCIAKTGTLDYVTNLAGYCHTRGGHMLAFALFIDGPDNEQAIVLLSRLVAAVAKY